MRCLGSRYDLIARVVRQHDRRLLLGASGGDHFDLTRDRVLRRRAFERQLAGVAQLCVGLFSALVGLIEHQNPEEFRQQHHVFSRTRRNLDGIRIGEAGAPQHQRSGQSQ